MTAWVITQTNRFKAAMVGAGLTNMWSMYGTNDIPSVLIAYFGGIPNKETLPLYLDRSAMSHVDKVTTPTLILHGANDERVPIGQPMELYRGAEGSRQADRAGVLPARRPRDFRVLSSEGPPAADLRLGDEVHPRHGRQNDDTTMTEPAPHGAASSSASDAELLAILAELGREVTLGPRPQRPAREDPEPDLAADLVHGLLGLPAARAARRAEHRLRRRLPRRNREALHAAGRPGRGRHRDRRAAADPVERRRRRPALPGRGAGRQVAARGAAAPQGQGDRRAEPVERSSSAPSPSATSGSSGSSAPTSRRRS